MPVFFFVYNQSANILLPFDNSSNSKRALKKAITLAKLMNCKITIVHVIAYHQTVAKIVGPYKNSLIKYVDEFIEKAKTSAKKSGVITEEKILYGSPSEEILNFTKKKRFDLVVLGRRGTSKLTGQSIGSVSNSLVQNSKVPVLVVT